MQGQREVCGHQACEKQVEFSLQYCIPFSHTINIVLYSCIRPFSSYFIIITKFSCRCQFCRLQKCLVVGMRSDSPRVAAASEARRSSSQSSGSKQVSLEAEKAYDSPTLLPRQSLVFPSHLGHREDSTVEQRVHEGKFAQQKNFPGWCISLLAWKHISLKGIVQRILRGVLFYIIQFVFLSMLIASLLFS
jgi:hypothetical protein